MRSHTLAARLLELPDRETRLAFDVIVVAAREAQGGREFSDVTPYVLIVGTRLPSESRRAPVVTVPVRPRAATVRVTGHALQGEGAAFDKRGRSRDGVGRALCECRATSDPLSTTAARKRWHRAHKAGVLADLAGGGS